MVERELSAHGRLFMIDVNLIRTNPELVRENIKKKFQDRKLPLVDEVLALDEKRRALILEGDALRAQRNVLSKQVGALMKAGDIDPDGKTSARHEHAKNKKHKTV